MSDSGAPQSRLVVDVPVGERLVFAGTRIEVQVLHKTGRAARLCIKMPRDIEIERHQPNESSAEGLAVVAPSVAV